MSIDFNDAVACCTRGYEALTHSCAWHSHEQRGLFAITGDDRTRFANAMFTAEIRNLKPGDGRYTLALDARGRIVSDAWVLVLEDSILLDTEPEAKEVLPEHLQRHLIGDDAELHALHPAYHAVTVEGTGELPSLLRRLAGGAPADRAVSEIPHGWSAEVTSTGLPGMRFWISSEAVPGVCEFLRSAGIAEAATTDLRVVRLELGRPRFGDELSVRFLGPEANLAGAIAPDKGCYLGQEVVERVRSRHLLGRCIVPVSSAASDGAASVPPEAGTKLLFRGQRAGEVLSADYSPALDRVVGLANVRIECATAGEILAWEGEPSCPFTVGVPFCVPCDASHGFHLVRSLG